MVLGYLDHAGSLVVDGKPRGKMPRYRRMAWYVYPRIIALGMELAPQPQTVVTRAAVCKVLE